MKDYYQILEVTPESTEVEIRKSYRRLAMEYHPDRNPDKPGAEEKFKEIAEAYGVLTDPVKRRQYDAARAMGADRHAHGAAGFNYSQEDILRDLFNDPRFQHVFQGLLREFQRQGFRAGEQFVRKSFFGNRGGLFFGGLFVFGSVAGPALLKKTARKRLRGKKSLLGSLGSAVGSMLIGRGRRQRREIEFSGTERLETIYTAYLDAEEFQQGKVVELVTRGPQGQERLKVKIPAGSRAGQKLRLPGRGLPGPEGRGDLFLTLKKK